jgi:pyridoxamine 5'-phosphate oxidase
MVEWMHDLQALLDAEFIKRPIVASLATVDADGKPHARMMVIRHLDARNLSIWMSTDGRSGKILDLQRQPITELLVWAPSERQQFRLRGPMRVHTEGPERQQLWQLQRDDNRASFFWPAPGLPRESEATFPSAVRDSVPPPENFLVLALHPEEVESLELNEHPHRRRRWIAADGWKRSDINP